MPKNGFEEARTLAALKLGETSTADEMCRKVGLSRDTYASTSVSPLLGQPGSANTRAPYQVAERLNGGHAPHERFTRA